ncbi:MAG: DUF3293 domain-containing protein [Dokdonella sp.]
MTTAPDETAAQIRDLLAMYRRTHYRVALPDHTGSTIRIGVAAPDPITNWIGTDDFAAYLTACNPYSQSLSDRQNDERLAELRDRLHKAGARFLEGIASVPDESWFEPSLLVNGIPLIAIDAIASRYEQNAVVIVPARGDARLRVYRAAWRDASVDVTDLEWSSPDA